MILNCPEEDFTKIDIGQIVNFEDAALIVEKKAASDRPRSAKRPGTAKKKKPLEKIENEKPAQAAPQPAPEKMFPKAKGLN